MRIAWEFYAKPDRLAAMILWRITGWCLLVMAFVFTAAEAVVHGLLKEYGIVASSKVLEVLAPDTLAHMKAAIVDNISSLAWDPFMLSLLQLPGWILLGGPGVFLVWFFRDRTPGDSELPDDYPHTTYEDIVAAAEEADYDDIGLPSKYRDLSDYDPTEKIDGNLPGYLTDAARRDDLAAVENPKKIDVMSVVRNLPRPGSDGSDGKD
jgi:hypothetical protein